jgi:hypothetical protein
MAGGVQGFLRRLKQGPVETLRLGMSMNYENSHGLILAVFPSTLNIQLTSNCAILLLVAPKSDEGGSPTKADVLPRNRQSPNRVAPRALRDQFQQLFSCPCKFVKSVSHFCFLPRRNQVNAGA